MLILSIDSAGYGCSACVWRDGKVLALLAEPMERGQDQRLMPLILEAMKQAGVDFPALDRIAVTRGPGSFTGLRIGLAAGRGIGLASDKPVLGIDRFAIYREQNKAPNLLVVIDSRRAELFTRYYQAKHPAGEPGMMDENEIRAFAVKHSAIVAGDKKIADAEYQPPSENEAVTCATLAARATIGDTEFLPRPLYIRAPDVTFPKSA